MVARHADVVCVIEHRTDRAAERVLWHTGRMRNVLSVALLVVTALSLPSLAAQAPPNDVTPQAQRIVDLLVKQDFATAFAEFTPAMRAAMPEDKLRATWEALIAQVGAFKQQRGVRLETRGDIRVAIVTEPLQRDTR